MKSWNKAITMGILTGMAGGLLCTGCGKKSATTANNLSGDGTAPAQANGQVKWSHKGTQFTAVTVLAKNQEFFGNRGVMLTFCNEDVPPGTSTFKKTSVEVFFPAQASGYGKPISVAFHKGSETIAQSGNYDGQLTASGSKLRGKLDINKIGSNDDCSITGSFETTAGSITEGR